VTWTAYTPSTQHAIIEYGIITRIELSFESPIASYDEVGVFPPKASVIFENMSEPLQIAWGESQANGGYNSTSGVYYAMLGSNGTVLNKFQIAETQAPLRDVSITPIAGQGGAFVTWETQAANASVYVSQISARGQLSYVRELNYTTGESKFLTVSMYSDGNLFVMWYQPSVATAGASTSVTQSTNVSYFRLNLDGAIVQAGSGSFSVPIMGVTVLNDGAVYGVAPDRLVRAVSPVQKQQNNLLALGAIALMSCIGAAGFAGSVVVEDWRYRWVALYSRIASRISKESPSARHRIIRLLARKPGLKLREIKRASGDHPIDITSLVRMEKDGLLASFQDGLSRRFYLKDTEIGKADALRTRILLWVLEHPGIWEAQLAKELGLSQQIVHYHLKKLRETKMITSGTDSSGIRKFYRFVDGSHDAVKQ
jgi:DNA-binding transcriptional ArsR family regulator